MPERIVCFGGAFDPVHNGHLIVARSLAEQRGFGRIKLIPTAQPPHKAPTHSPGEDRLEMLRRAVANEPLFEVSAIELHRDGPSYTINTVYALKQRHGQDAEIGWIIGADMLAILPKWHRVEELLAEAKIITAARPPWPGKMDRVFARLAGSFTESQVRAIREGVTETPLIDLSSTEIRQRVREKKSIRYMAPDAVVEYVLEQGLYRT